jgi:hypothetical protein
MRSDEIEHTVRKAVVIAWEDSPGQKWLRIRRT